MKRMVLWVGAVIGFVGVMLGVAVVRGSQVGIDPRVGLRSGNCTLGDVRGTYGFVRSGTTAQGPIAAVGKAIFDGRGFFSVVQTTSRNGVFSEGSFDGQYDINADCTGRWLTPDGQGQIAYFVVVDNGKELIFLSISAGNTITGNSKRVSE